MTIKDEATENPKIHIYETLMLSISLVRNVVKGNISINKWGGNLLEIAYGVYSSEYTGPEGWVYKQLYIFFTLSFYPYEFWQT